MNKNKITTPAGVCLPGYGGYMSTQNFSNGKSGELVIGDPGRVTLNEDMVERNWNLENYVRNASLERAYSDIQSAEAFNLRVSDVKNELQLVIPR